MLLLAELPTNCSSHVLGPYLSVPEFRFLEPWGFVLFTGLKVLMSSVVSTDKNCHTLLCPKNALTPLKRVALVQDD